MSLPAFLPPLPFLSVHSRHSLRSQNITFHPACKPPIPTPTCQLPPPPPAATAVTLTPTTRNPDWMFYDVARVLVKAGTGGNGCIAFRREKGIARGGPAGGSGGSGGSVIFTAISGANTLAKFRGGATFRAIHGLNGTGKGRRGVSGKDMIVPVPVGTVVREISGNVLADLSDEGAEFCVARGGRGGRGNLAFKTERHRAPRMCEVGEPGVERWITLELKLVADVALVGCPNAGKSSVLDAVSNARPKIADYPFTTVVPNLGVIEGIEELGVVVADVPGLIEGAHRGVGMGVAFLRHVERCRVVVHVLDGSLEGVVERYRAIRLEMELFDDRLARKKEVVLVNKIDIQGVRERWDNGLKDELVAAIGTHKRVAIVSAKTRENLKQCMRRIVKLVQTVGDQDNIVVLGDEDGFGIEPATVEKESAGVFRVSGYKVERVFRMTNWDYVENIERFQRVLAALGVNRMLEEAGAVDGDSISCFERVFDYYKEENTYSYAASLDGYVD